MIILENNILIIKTDIDEALKRTRIVRKSKEVRMSSHEQRKRRIAQKKAARKRKAKMSSIIRLRKKSISKKRSWR